jgi:hypothetical protein
MGGHAAWRKRVAAGELAKGSGGAALRHRPRLGRKGADLALNRLGNLGGHGNPKRKITKRTAVVNRQKTTDSLLSDFHNQRQVLSILLFIIIAFYVALLYKLSTLSFLTFQSNKI